MMKSKFKPGDIIYAPYNVDKDSDDVNGYIAIYKDKKNDNSILYYVLLSKIGDSSCCLFFDDSCLSSDFIHATDNQKEFLYKYLREKGYAWDFYNKKIATLENKKYEKKTFNWRLVEKIIKGEIKGYVCTEAGYKVNKLLSSIFLNNFGSVDVITVMFPDSERVVVINNEGRIVLDDKLSDDRLSIYLECEELQLEPFQKVLARDARTSNWQIDLYSRFDDKYEFPHICLCHNYKYCIPYNDSTKRLLGTSDDY